MNKLTSALEGGLAGAATISLLRDTLKKINGHSSHINLFDGKNLQKRLKKSGSKKPLKAAKKYINLAGDLLGSTAFLGLSSLSKKKNALLRGALLGTAAGIGSVWLREDDDTKVGSENEKDNFLTKALEVSLYTIGGMIASKVIEKSVKKRKR